MAAPLTAAMAKGVDQFSPDRMAYVESLRDLFESSLLENLEGVEVNGKGPRICNTSNLYFHGVEGELLLQRLDMKGLHAVTARLALQERWSPHMFFGNGLPKRESAIISEVFI